MFSSFSSRTSSNFIIYIEDYLKIVKPCQRVAYATACCLKLLIFTSFYVRNRRNCRPAVQGRGWYEIFVNRLAAEKGAAVEFDKVLLIDEDGAVKVGAPYVEGAKVSATVLDDTCKGKKVLVFKKKRRKGYQKMNGHRQYLTKLQINAIA